MYRFHWGTKFTNTDSFCHAQLDVAFHCKSCALADQPLPSRHMSQHRYIFIQHTYPKANTKTNTKKQTHIRTDTHTHTHTHTHFSSSSGLLAPKGVGQDPGSSLGPVSEANRLSNGWAGQAHARQPWGEWLLGTLAVKMAVRARQVDRRYAVATGGRDGNAVQLPAEDPRGCGERVVLTGGVQRSVKVAGLRWMEPDTKPRQKLRLVPTGS